MQQSRDPLHDMAYVGRHPPIVAGQQLDRLGQSFVPLGSFLQPLIDGHSHMVTGSFTWPAKLKSPAQTPVPSQQTQPHPLLRSPRSAS